MLKLGTLVDGINTWSYFFSFYESHHFKAFG